MKGLILAVVGFLVLLSGAVALLLARRTRRQRRPAQQKKAVLSRDFDFGRYKRYEHK